MFGCVSMASWPLERGIAPLSCPLGGLQLNSGVLQMPPPRRHLQEAMLVYDIKTTMVARRPPRAPLPPSYPPHLSPLRRRFPDKLDPQSLPPTPPPPSRRDGFTASPFPTPLPQTNPQHPHQEQSPTVLTVPQPHKTKTSNPRPLHRPRLPPPIHPLLPNHPPRPTHPPHPRMAAPPHLPLPALPPLRQHAPRPLHRGDHPDLCALSRRAPRRPCARRVDRDCPRADQRRGGRGATGFS